MRQRTKVLENGINMMSAKDRRLGKRDNVGTFVAAGETVPRARANGSMKDIGDVSTLEARAGCKGEAKGMVGIKVKRKRKVETSWKGRGETSRSGSGRSKSRMSGEVPLRRASRRHALGGLMLRSVIDSSKATC